MKYEPTQQLADLQVECLNKDKTIQEHEKHIEEMKDDVRKLEAELQELRKKQIEVEEQHTKDIETMVDTIFLNASYSTRTQYYLALSFHLQAKLQQEVLSNHDEKHQTEMQMLRTQLLEASEEKEREFSARKTMEKELRNRAAELSGRLTTLEAELCAKKEENKTKVNYTCFILNSVSYIDYYRIMFLL